LRAGESQFGTHLAKKHVYHQNSAEGYATTERVAWSIKNSTFLNNELYDFSDHTLAYVVEEWQAAFLHDSQTRELARNEPWKSLWVIKDNTNIKLFNNSSNSELTYNQKNLIVWSQMYDNIQESLDCPSKDVIDDDDMLDGWFITQAKKREQEKSEQELNESTKNSKIKNASEVFVMANSKNDAERINSVNTTHSQVIKKQRGIMLKQKGTVNDHDFTDQRQKIQMEQTNMFRGNIKGG
jgi:muconolactone delta-isomerase